MDAHPAGSGMGDPAVRVQVNERDTCYLGYRIIDSYLACMLHLPALESSCLRFKPCLPDPAYTSAASLAALLVEWLFSENISSFLLQRVEFQWFLMALSVLHVIPV